MVGRRPSPVRETLSAAGEDSAHTYTAAGRHAKAVAQFATAGERTMRLRLTKRGRVVLGERDALTRTLRR